MRFFLVNILNSFLKTYRQTLFHPPKPSFSVDVRYWPEIDGLRAFAVLFVILYHLDAHLVPGGFIGVDIFFVISGYVVSRSLAHCDQSSFSSFISDFYARRLARIIPALMLCLMITSLAMVLLIPNAWLSGTNQKTARFAVLGISNFALVATDNYFSPRPEFNPFTHTWSLGVEEQFYLIFPFIFYTWVKFSHKNNFINFILKLFLFIFLILSFIFLYFIQIVNPSVAFYMLPARFWELATGGLLYQLQVSHLKKFLPSAQCANIIGILGFVLILASAYGADRQAFPFPWSLPPVIGTVLILSAITQTNRAINDLVLVLRQDFLVFIGKISYSLYLWHWAVYCLFRWTIGLETFIQMFFAVLISFIFAKYSYIYIEKPMNISRKFINYNKYYCILRNILYIFLCYVVILLCFKFQHIISLSTVTQNAALWYPTDHVATDAEAGCTIQKKETNKNILRVEIFSRTCTRSTHEGPMRRVFVIGDSHAGAYRPLLTYLAGHRDISVVIYSFADCAYANFLRPSKPECRAHNQAMTDNILEQVNPGDMIFLSSLRMNRLVDQWAPLSDVSVKMATVGPEAELNRQMAYDEAVRLLKQLAQKPIHIILEAPKPVFPAPAFRCSDWFNATNPICRKGLTRSRTAIEADRAPIMASLEKVSGELKSVTVWDPLPILCPNALCAATTAEGPLFFDGDHLSHLGNERLIPSFLALIDQFQTQ